MKFAAVAVLVSGFAAASPIVRLETKLVEYFTTVAYYTTVAIHYSDATTAKPETPSMEMVEQTFLVSRGESVYEVTVADTDSAGSTISEVATVTSVVEAVVDTLTEGWAVAESVGTFTRTVEVNESETSTAETLGESLESGVEATETLGESLKTADLAVSTEDLDTVTETAGAVVSDGVEGGVETALDATESTGYLDPVTETDVELLDTGTATSETSEIEIIESVETGTDTTETIETNETTETETTETETTESLETGIETTGTIDSFETGTEPGYEISDPWAETADSVESMETAIETGTDPSTDAAIETAGTALASFETVEDVETGTALSSTPPEPHTSETDHSPSATTLAPTAPGVSGDVSEPIVMDTSTDGQWFLDLSWATADPLFERPLWSGDSSADSTPETTSDEIALLSTTLAITADASSEVPGEDEILVSEPVVLDQISVTDSGPDVSTAVDEMGTETGESFAEDPVLETTLSDMMYETSAAEFDPQRTEHPDLQWVYPVDDPAYPTDEPGVTSPTETFFFPTDEPGIHVTDELFDPNTEYVDDGQRVQPIGDFLEEFTEQTTEEKWAVETDPALEPEPSLAPESWFEPEPSFEPPVDEIATTTETSSFADIDGVYSSFLAEVHSPVLSSVYTITEMGTAATEIGETSETGVETPEREKTDDFLDFSPETVLGTPPALASSTVDGAESTPVVSVLSTTTPNVDPITEHTVATAVADSTSVFSVDSPPESQATTEPVAAIEDRDDVVKTEPTAPTSDLHVRSDRTQSTCLSPLMEIPTKTCVSEPTTGTAFMGHPPPVSGHGACPMANSNPQYLASVGDGIFNQRPRNSENACGMQLVAHCGERSVEVTVADRLGGGGKYDLSISPAAFSRLADQKKGHINVTWEWV